MFFFSCIMTLSTIMNGSPATSRLLAELYGCSHLGTQASLQHVWLSCMNATEAQSCSLCKGLLACSGVLSSPAHRRVVDIEQCYATFRLAKLLFTCSFVHVRCDVSSPPVVLYPRSLAEQDFTSLAESVVLWTRPVCLDRGAESFVNCD